MTDLLTELHRAGGYAEFRAINSDGAVTRFFKHAGELGDKSIRFLTELYGASNIYFSAVPRIRLGGSKSDCGVASAVWCDYDVPERIPEWKLGPSAAVSTSPGKLQVYWLLSEPERDLAVIESLNRSIAQAHGGDAQATDRARVLRLPGSRNHKYPDRPVVTFAEWSPHVRYSIEELLATYPSIEPLYDRPSSVSNADAPSWLPLVFQAIADYLERNGFRPVVRDDSLVSLCPLHDDNNPSLSVHSQRGWYCHAGCGSGRITRLANLLGVRV